MRFGAVALLGLLAACGSDDPTDPGGALSGSYTATVTGAIDAALAGTAFFGSGTDPDTQQPAWIAYLVESEQAGFATGEAIAFFGLGAPQSRTYLLEDAASGEFPDGEAGGFVIVYDGTSLSGIFYSSAGSLTVTSVTSNQMNGTFSFTAEGVTFPPGGGPPVEGP